MTTLWPMTRIFAEAVPLLWRVALFDSFPSRAPELTGRSFEIKSSEWAVHSVS